jgi:hypothetical protein
MRLSSLVVLLLVPVGARAAADDDDPKLARGDNGVALRAVLPEEDDPKLARGAEPSGPRARIGLLHQVPRFKLGYRRLVAAGLEGGEIAFNAFALDFYPSSGYLRFGLDAELGIGERYTHPASGTLSGYSFDSWYFTTGATLGLQYPARVTPFVEARFVAGLLGGSALGQTAVSYIYTGGLETGIELYYASRFYLSAAIGWAHPTYSGIDVSYTRLNPRLAPHRKEFADDSFTFKLGLGL